jgi:hypothetical protein
MGGLIHRILLRITDERQERCAGALGAIAFVSLGIYSLVRGADDFRNCDGIPNLSNFAVTFSVLSIVLGLVRMGMAVERIKTGADDFSRNSKVIYAAFGIVLVGLACWGSALTFGKNKDAPSSSCRDLFHVARTQCIITWVMFSLVILRQMRKRGIIPEEDGSCEDIDGTNQQPVEAPQKGSDEA